VAAHNRGGEEAVRARVQGSVGVRVRRPRAQVTSDRRANRRIRLILATFIVVFGIALGRAAWLQVVHAATYSRQAQRMHEETTTTPAGRGSILDRTGVQLAIGEQDTTVYADPHLVTDARGIAL